MHNVKKIPKNFSIHNPGRRSTHQPAAAPIPIPVRKNEHLELLTYLSRVPACVSDLAADLGCSELEIMSLVAQLRKSLEINVIVEHFTVCIDAKDWAVARTLAQQFMEPETDPSPSD